MGNLVLGYSRVKSESSLYPINYEDVYHQLLYSSIQLLCDIILSVTLNRFFGYWYTSGKPMSIAQHIYVVPRDGHVLLWNVINYTTN